MKQIVCTAFLTLSLSILFAQENYRQAWDALNNNDRNKAVQLLQQAGPGGDNFITRIYLQTYNGKDKQVTDFDASFYDKADNPYPYIYALWFNDAVLGSYGKKRLPHQLRLIDKIISDGKAPGTLVAAAHYQKGMHFLSSYEMDNAAREFDKIGNIRNWQYVGPFENLSESGIYKEYGPLKQPEADAVFTSNTNAPIKWFSPVTEDKDGWTPTCFQISKRTAVVYAQTFVAAPDDQDVYFNVGATGAIRVWLNDAPLLSEYKERTTEMDTYTVKCKLKKGNNRILVQLGYTGENYPNFSVRLTDAKYNPLPGLSGSNVYAPYNKATDNAPYQPMPHFAEAFFTAKVAAEPDNLVNYLLLADTYLRNKKTLEARNIIEAALQKAPHNCLLRMKLIEVLGKETNRSKTLEEIEALKKDDPESLFTLYMSIKDDIDNQKYEDAFSAITKKESLYGEDETTAAYRLLILYHENKYDDMVKAGEEIYKKYPEQESLLPMMYSIRKDVYKDSKGAMKLYENYLKNNFSAGVLRKYGELLQEQGQNDKSLQLKMRMAKDFPYDPDGFSVIAGYYYGVKEYDKAEEYTNKALQLSPYNQTYWELMGDIKREAKKSDQAIAAYNKSLMYDPNQYDVINKIRKLQGKEESYKLVPETNIDSIIRADNQAEAKNTDYGYYFINDEKNVIVHPGGATEEYYLYLIRITNEKGIDKYKESTIGYGNSQELLIEKSMVIKKSGAKIEGDRNDNQIVFTNLEAGDVVVFKYRLQSFVYGRFAREYWDKYYFGSQIYTAREHYSLLLPADQPVHYVFTSTDFKPAVKTVEGFKQYTWDLVKQEPMKEEPLMPNNCDVGTVLHISTLSSWQDIASWYTDLINNRAEEDFEITSLFNNLFPDKGKTKLSQFEQAKLIYNYIEKNIRYSSVSFRQSAYVPQRASATLNTRLGDCKDLSNLFVTLCRMAHIECRMVLVNTRNNGVKDILLPSVEFNHCIVKARLDNKDYYIELTDNHLPFASLPNNLPGASILEIPMRKSTEVSDLKALADGNRTRDIVKRVIDIKPTDKDLAVNVICTKYGHFSADIRDQYANLDHDKQVIEMEKTVAQGYKNNIKLDKLSFPDLGQLSDSVKYTYSFKVRNEIAEIGSIQTFRISYPDVVATLNNFSADTRVFPIEYDNYEDADGYETVVNIEAPAGKKFIELPANESLQFKNLSFSISYRLVNPGKLVVVRKFSGDRKVIPAADYTAFKSFFEKIITAEQKMIAFK